MKKILLILVTTLLLISNLVIPTTVLSKGWKGEGTKIEFESMPILTMKDFLQKIYLIKILKAYHSLFQ